MYNVCYMYKVNSNMRTVEHTCKQSGICQEHLGQENANIKIKSPT